MGGILEIIQTVASVLLAATVPYLTYMTGKLHAVQQQKLDALAKVAHQTHLLVNSHMAYQLRLNAIVTRRLAKITNEPEDARAAELAEQLSHDHDSRQAAADAQSALIERKPGDTTT